MEDTKVEEPISNKEPKQQVEEVDRSVQYKYDPDYHRFSDFLGVDTGLRSDSDLAQKIATIYDWGKNKTNGKDRVDILMAIKDLKSYLGLNLEGETLVKKLYKWVRLDQDRRRIEKEMELVNA